ncbi:MAG: hypothetical protein R2911_27470 [Caldilineaceae bacterium]
MLATALLATALLTARPLQAAQPVGPARCPAYLAPAARFGFNFDLSDGQTLAQYEHAALHAGWYLDYDFRGAPRMRWPMCA